MEYEPTETASRHRLDNLPIEVIHRIVVTGSCKTTLSFAAANRRLHSICYQHLLFRKLVEARHGESLSEPMSWWKRATGSNSKDIGLAARWAFADELASGFTSRTCSSPMSAKTLEWVIPLLIVGHPASLILPHKFLKPGGYHGVSVTEGVVMPAFFFAYQMSLSSSLTWLEHQFKNETPPLTLINHATITKQLLGPLSDGRSPLASPVVIDESDSGRIHPRSMDESSVRIHAQVLMGLGVFAPLLKTSPDIALTSACTPPEATNIRYISLVGSSPPFGALSDTTFTRQYIESMVESSFLENGEWVGFYCHSLGMMSHSMRPILDGEMQGIQFEVVGKAPGGALLVASSHGQDSIGQFHLWGSICPGSGLVTMCKSYMGGHPRWLWQGAMTPFGLAGSWGDESYGGWFWLWKKAWSAESTSQP